MLTLCMATKRDDLCDFSRPWNIFVTLLLFTCDQRELTPSQHEISFRALSLWSVRVDGVSSTSAFHYSFSPSPPSNHPCHFKHWLFSEEGLHLLPGNY